MGHFKSQADEGLRNNIMVIATLTNKGTQNFRRAQYRFVSGAHELIAYGQAFMGTY